MSKIDNEIKEGTPRFKKGDAFVGMAPHPLVYMEVNEVEVSQSYTKENGCKTGGKVGGDVVENIIDVPSMSPACPRLCHKFCHKLCHKLIKGGKHGHKRSNLQFKGCNLG